MKRPLFIYPLILLLLFSCASAAQEKKGSSPYFFFVQMTDPQFGFYDDNNGFEKETAQYSKAIEAINRIKPDFVVITGDFVNNRSIQAQWDEFNRLNAKISTEIPVFLVPGNHDLGQIPGKDDIDEYVAQNGDDKFSFVHKNIRFIGFNSCLIKAGVEIEEQVQYEWLKEQLEKRGEGKYSILFCHHPLFIRSTEEPETYSNIGPEPRNKYLDLFKNNGVKAIFSGHYHNNAYARHRGIEIFTTNAIGKPLGEARPGLRIVKIYRNKLITQYFELEEIPEVITSKDKVKQNGY